MTAPAAEATGDDACDDLLPPPPAARPFAVPERALRNYRISGDSEIQPPEQVAIEMARDAVDAVTGTVRMCLDDTGAVADLTTVKSTGYKLYDDELLRVMRGWRYRPFQVNGNAVAVCTAVTFVYRQR